ncbi:MAG: hypothetical protein RIT28_4312, partial [Pseudomonadota bacterium]
MRRQLFALHLLPLTVTFACAPEAPPEGVSSPPVAAPEPAPAAKGPKIPLKEDGLPPLWKALRPEAVGVATLAEPGADGASSLTVTFPAEAVVGAEHPSAFGPTTIRHVAPPKAFTLRGLDGAVLAELPYDDVVTLRYTCTGAKGPEHLPTITLPLPPMKLSAKTGAVVGFVVPAGGPALGELADPGMKGAVSLDGDAGVEAAFVVEPAPKGLECPSGRRERLYWGGTV